MNDMMTVGELEQRLFGFFPREDAESWDKPGLAVGDRAQGVARVAVGLDMSATNVIAAHAAGCNVLVTHHPPFISDAPREFGPEAQPQASGPGRMIYEAALRNVSAIAMHTNVDRAIATRERFAELMGCACAGNCEFMFDPCCDMHGKGLGALLVPDWDDASTLGLVAEVAARSFATRPRVWGDSDRPVERIAFLNGSWSDPATYECCVSEGVDCLVVGETRYHMCVDAQPYLSIVELGHDRSELPIVDVLVDALASCGVEESSIVDLRGVEDAWWTAG